VEWAEKTDVSTPEEVKTDFSTEQWKMTPLENVASLYLHCVKRVAVAQTSLWRKSWLLRIFGDTLLDTVSCLEKHETQ
jgi:hypothetical protein